MVTCSFLFYGMYPGSGTLELPHFEALQVVTAISADIKPELQKCQFVVNPTV